MRDRFRRARGGEQADDTVIDLTDEAQPDASTDTPDAEGQDATDEAQSDGAKESDEAPVPPVATGEGLEFGGSFVRLPDLPKLPDRETVRSKLRTASLIAVMSRRAPQLPEAAIAIVPAVWAAVVGLLTSLLLTLVSAVDLPPVAVAQQLWLTAHHIVIQTPSGGVTLLPLGLMLIAGLPLRRAGRFVTVQMPDAPRARLMGLIGAGVYAAIVAVNALTTGPPVARPLVAATLWGLLVALVAGWWGLSRDDRRSRRTPVLVPAVTSGALVPMAVGSVLLVGLLVMHREEILATQTAVAQSGMEQVGLILLQLAYLPNLVVWAGAYAIGTGFEVGADQVISPFTTAQPGIPALPVLSALPTDSPSWTGLLPVLVAIGGAASAMLVDRRIPVTRLGSRIARALVLAGATGITWFVLSVLAGGSLGDGRLDHLGPTAATPLAAAALSAAGGLLWALLPTLASDAAPWASDLRTRVGSSGRRGPGSGASASAGASREP